MVEILQKCLQQYSGVSILRARKKMEGDEENSPSEASTLFDKLLQIDTDSWDDEIRSGVGSSDDITTQKLTNEIQKTMVRNFCSARGKRSDTQSILLNSQHTRERSDMLSTSKL